EDGAAGQLNLRADLELLAEDVALVAEAVQQAAAQRDGKGKTEQQPGPAVADILQDAEDAAEKGAAGHGPEEEIADVGGVGRDQKGAGQSAKENAAINERGTFEQQKENERRQLPSGPVALAQLDAGGEKQADRQTAQTAERD